MRECTFVQFIKKYPAAIFCSLLGILQSSILHAADSNKCHRSLTAEPPFYLTTVNSSTKEDFQLGGRSVPVQSRVDGGSIATSEISSEDFKTALAHEAPGTLKFISRGSQVRLLDGNLQSYRASAPDTLLKVEVAAETTRYERFKPGEAAKPGDSGFIAKGALTPVGSKDVLILKSNTVLVTLGGSATQWPAGYTLRPKLSGSQYVIETCAGVITYVFTISPPENSLGDRVSGEAYLTEVEYHEENACWVPFSEDRFKSLLRLKRDLDGITKSQKTVRLEDLDINDWGLAKLPMRHTGNPTNITDEALDGSFVHYQNGDPIDSNTWGQPDAICSLIKLAHDWNQHCQSKFQGACQLQVGDISFVTPAEVQSSQAEKRDPLGHIMHYTGRCIDIRAFRKDQQQQALNVVNSPSDYDQEKTHDLLQFLIKSGASPIYFNDPGAFMSADLGEGSKACNLTSPTADVGHKVQYCEGHDNHIHFCLEPRRTEGCKP